MNSENTEFEVDILESFKALIASWKFILTITFIFSIVGISSSFLLTKIYRSYAQVLPVMSQNGPNVSSGLASLAESAALSGLLDQSNLASSNTDKAMHILRSRSFFEDLTKKDGFIEDFFELENIEDFNLIKGYDQFVTSNLFISKDFKTGLITIKLLSKDPNVSFKWLSIMMEDIDLILRNRDKTRYNKSIEYLTELSEKEANKNLSSIVSKIIESNLSNLALVDSYPEYSFILIDPPYFEPKRVKPSRTTWTILFFVTGLFVSIIFSFVSFLVNKKPVKIFS